MIMDNVVTFKAVRLCRYCAQAIPSWRKSSALVCTSACRTEHVNAEKRLKRQPIKLAGIAPGTYISPTRLQEGRLAQVGRSYSK